jgi:high-affinity nickel-transport protein
MDLIAQNLSGLILLLVLGLRHGLDPDHIAMIDGYTYRLHENKNKWSKWVGSLFTFGHGLMVTLISLFLSLLKNKFEIPPAIEYFITWFPMLMLLYIGITNILILQGKTVTKRFSLKQCLMPVHFNKHLNPFSIILTGLVFGFIFDTSSQIAAFGYTMSASDQWLFAVLGGLVFSTGLMITGTCDSILLNKLLKSFEQKKIQNFRFKINLLITIMCFAIPLYKIMCFINPTLELSDFQNNIVGLTFISIIISLYVDLYLRYKFSILKAN